MRRRTIAIALALCLSPGAAAQPVSLAPRPHTDQTLRYDLMQTNRTAFGAQAAELNSRTRFSLAFERAESGATATYTLERLVVDLAQPGMRAFFDSEAPATDEPSPLAPALQPLIGAQATMTVDAAGQIDAVDVGANASNQAAPMAGMTAEAVNDAVSRALAVPGAPAAVSEGDRWTWVRRDAMSPGVTISVAHDMLVESIKGDLVTITFTGGASVEFDQPAAPDERRPTLDGSEVSGRIVWDAARGCAKSWDYLSSVTMTAVNAQDQTQTAPIRMERTLRLQRVNE